MGFTLRSSPRSCPSASPALPPTRRTRRWPAESATWNFEEADATPEIALNEAIWKSIKGRHSTMPRPRHSYIVGSVPNDEEEEAEAEGGEEEAQG